MAIDPIEMPRCKQNRLPLPELLFLPSSLADLVELREALAAAGHSRAKVAGCIEFVMGRAKGNDRTSAPGASEYRKMLAGLLVSPVDGGDPSRDEQRALIVARLRSIGATEEARALGGVYAYVRRNLAKGGGAGPFRRVASFARPAAPAGDETPGRRPQLSQN